MVILNLFFPFRGQFYDLMSKNTYIYFKDTWEYFCIFPLD